MGQVEPHAQQGSLPNPAVAILVAILSFGVLLSCSRPAPVAQEDKAAQKAAQTAAAPQLSPLAQFGSGTCEVSQLSGFYPPENWGAWSGKDPAEITLKNPLSGTVTLELIAYTLDDGKPHQLKVTVGDVTRTVKLTPQPTKFALEYTLSAPAQKIILSGVKPRAAKTDSRLMGVGFVHLDCK